MKNISQCIVCQRYSHARTYFNRAPHCIRCGLGHDSASCTETRETPTTCAHCKGSHPAIYHGCLVLKNLKTQWISARISIEPYIHPQAYNSFLLLISPWTSSDQHSKVWCRWQPSSKNLLGSRWDRRLLIQRQEATQQLINMAPPDCFSY